MADALRERGKTAWAAEIIVGCAAMFTGIPEFAERIADRWNGAIAPNNLGDPAIQAGDSDRSSTAAGAAPSAASSETMGNGARAQQRRIRRAPARQALVRRVEGNASRSTRA